MGKNSNVVSLGQYFLSWSALWSGRSINLESGDLNSNPGSPVSQFFDSMKNYFLSLIFSLPLKYMPNKSLPGLLLRQATEWMQKHEWDSEMTVCYVPGSLSDRKQLLSNLSPALRSSHSSWREQEVQTVCERTLRDCKDQHNTHKMSWMWFYASRSINKIQNCGSMKDMDMKQRVPKEVTVWLWNQTLINSERDALKEIQNRSSTKLRHTSPEWHTVNRKLGPRENCPVWAGRQGCTALCYEVQAQWDKGKGPGQTGQMGNHKSSFWSRVGR